MSVNNVANESKAIKLAEEGQKFAKTGDYRTAERKYLESIQLVDHCVTRYYLGHLYFKSDRYQEALEQSERGKDLDPAYPRNFFSIAMTIMQMIELGLIPEDQVKFQVEVAEQNIQECLRIAPGDPLYTDARNAIREIRRRYESSHKNKIMTQGGRPTNMDDLRHYRRVFFLAGTLIFMLDIGILSGIVIKPMCVWFVVLVILGAAYSLYLSGPWVGISKKRSALIAVASFLSFIAVLFSKGLI